ncbi:MAG: hypothetical protein ACI8W3_001504 [Myxococcota bacterium]|jgi:hypothetical protein
MKPADRHGVMRNGMTSSIAAGFLLGLAITLGVGCAGMIKSPARYNYFQAPDSGDAWSPKIAGWQRRERADDGSFFSGVNSNAADAVAQPVASEAAATEEGTQEFLPDDGLRGKYFGFRSDRRRAMARELAGWIQGQSRSHYVADGPIDHWATLEETLRGNGDDCDGLELLVYHALRDLGFAENEVYRAIVYRPSDGQHHMVTLWFEDRFDPWVIDPTGAMTTGMPQMSGMPEWVPLKVFSEKVEYSVKRDLSGASLAHNN